MNAAYFDTPLINKNLNQNFLGCIALIAIYVLARRNGELDVLLKQSLKETVESSLKRFASIRAVEWDLLRLLDSQDISSFSWSGLMQHLEGREDNEIGLAVIQRLEQERFSPPFWCDYALADLIKDWVIQNPADEVFFPSSIFNGMPYLIRTKESSSVCQMQDVTYKRLMDLLGVFADGKLQARDVELKLLASPEKNYSGAVLFSRYGPVENFVLQANRNIDFSEFFLGELLNNIKGRIAAIVQSRFLFNAYGAQADLRKRLIQSGQLREIIQLPPRLFTDAGFVSNLLLIDTAANKADQVHFVDLSHPDFYFSRYGRNALAQGAYEKAKENAISGKLSFYSASIEEISKNDWLLDFNRYMVPEDKRTVLSSLTEEGIKLSEIADLIRAQMVKQSDSKEAVLCHEIIASDIDGIGVVRHVGKKTVNALTKQLEKYQLKQGDILFAIKGSAGKVGIIENASTDRWIAGQSFVIIRIKPELKEQWRPEYVFRCLKSESIRMYIEQNITGQFINSFPINALKNLPIQKVSEEIVQEEVNKHKKQMQIIEQMDLLQQELLDLE